MRRFAIPFLDVMTLLVLVLLLLIFAALMKVSDTESKTKVDTSSKLLVSLAWRDGSNNDVDLWVKLPNDEAVGFRNRQAGFASLDHDNLGLGNSAVTDADGRVIVSNGRDEVIFVRQTMPGTYVVAAHLYSKSEDSPEPVTVTLTSVDPAYHVVVARQIILTERHEEITAFRFTVDASGAVTSTDVVEDLFVNEVLGERP